MGIGFSPGCECCNPCLACLNGLAPSKIQLTISGVKNFVGGFYQCCGNVNGTYLLPFQSGSPLVCLWQISISPACNGYGIINFAIEIVGGIYTAVAQVGATGEQGLSWHAGLGNSPPNCMNWNNLNLPLFHNSDATGCDASASTCLATAIA